MANGLDLGPRLPQAACMDQRHDFHTIIGVRILEWREGYARVDLALTPSLLNRSGILHGGVLLTMLDEAGSLCGLWCAEKADRRSSVTVDLDSRFVGQASTGIVYGVAELVSHGRSLYFARSQVTDADGRVLAYGSSTHKWRWDSRPPPVA